MRLELTGRHVDITPGLRRLVEGKLAKLERLLNDKALSAQAVLTRERRRHRADITLHARGEKFLHGFSAAATWEPAVSGAIDKIAQQAQKVKGKWEARKRESVRRAPLPAERREPVVARMPGLTTSARGAVRTARPRMPRVVRTDRQPIKPMTLADAAREVDTGGDGCVVVFRDRETEAISVLYRRRGELTLVKTEA
ncbi:MAG: ribosome-associated translation inhibitor RaiA [Acidobacteria bacterium]|nr:ribosome-associated translation inhibitor RaiA [Acidobacteriota bacterium]